EEERRKRKEVFEVICFPLVLWGCGALWLTAIRNRLRGRGALLTGEGLVMFFCLIAVLADLLAPYDYSSLSRREPLAPPNTIRFRDAQGRWHARPFIYARRLIDRATNHYEELTDHAYPL